MGGNVCVDKKIIMIFKIFRKNENVSHQVIETFDEFKVITDHSNLDNLYNTGYTSDEILNTTFNSIIRVKNGEFPYERDSVLFDKIEYNFPLISALMSVKSSGNKIKIVDFGGSLGTLYFQNKKILDQLNIDYDWYVIEQKHYVDKGKLFLEDEKLKFFYNLDEINLCNNSSLIIFSGVLQYLKNYKEIINQAIDKNPEFIFVDRTSFISDMSEVLTLQSVPSNIYNAKYINRFFNYDELINCFVGYEIIYNFDSFCDQPTKIFYQNNYIDVTWSGFFLKKQTNKICK
jgi:putative methyltransferase (TIGR04325 family)